MTASATDNADQVAYWNGAAGERWAALQQRIDGVFAPLTDAVIGFASLRPGASVIDVGCGTGATVLALAGAVGPSGRVLGVDVSEPMLAVARQRVAAAGLANASLLLADASVHPFTPSSTDPVFSRFGVMFFADPAAAFANLRTGLAEGGRFSFACWQSFEANSWFAVPVGALQPLLPPMPPSDPFAPGPMALADPERTRSLLARAGFRDIVIEPHRTDIDLGDLTQALDFVRQVGPASRALADADPAQRPALLDALRRALAAREDGGGNVVLGGAIWLVSAWG
jgi:SAM-dependent methyltransferase